LLFLPPYQRTFYCIVWLSLKNSKTNGMDALECLSSWFSGRKCLPGFCSYAFTALLLFCT